MTPPQVALAAQGPEQPGKPRAPARAAVVGLGVIAQEHLSCINALAAVSLAAVCDLSPAVAGSAAGRYRASGHFSDHREMLAAVRPDVVHVTTPPASHFEVSMDALAAGAHVIVEKPIVTSADELSRLLDEATRRDRIIVENYNYLFNPQPLEIQRLAAGNELGDVVHVDVNLALDILAAGSPFSDTNHPHPALGLPGGAIADFLPHLCSLVHVFAGPHRSAQAVWSKRRAGSPLELDDLRAVIEGERGTASISFSAASQPDGFWLRVDSTRMRVEANLFESRMTVQRVRSVPAPLFPVLNGIGEIRSLGRSAVGDLWGKLRGAPGAYSGLWELLARTYQAIRTASEPPVSPAQILDVNRLVADLTAQIDP